MPDEKLESGKSLRNCCIHHVGGERGNCVLTKKGRAAVRRDHDANLTSDGVHCTLHVPNWKAIGTRTAARNRVSR